jgi:hypothetical protein
MLKRLLRPLMQIYRDYMMAGLSGQIELLRHEQTRFYEEQLRFNEGLMRNFQAVTKNIETALLTIALHDDEARQDRH